MKKILPLLLIGLFLSLTVLNNVSATTTEEETIVRNHGPFYVGSKPLKDYDNPGFVCGFYHRIERGTSTSVRYLYSPYLLFGWDIVDVDYLPFNLFIIGAFASRVSFTQFRSTFVGIFTATEPGFICGFVDGFCSFTYFFDYDTMGANLV